MFEPPAFFQDGRPNRRREKAPPSSSQVVPKFLPRSSPKRPQRVRKSFQKGSREALGTLPGVPRAAQKRPRAPRCAEDRPKSAPRVHMCVPRAAQERPKSAQESPKSGQEAPKRAPRPSKREAGRLQEGSEVRPKRHSSEISKKPQFLQLDPLWLRDTGGHRKQQKIDTNRPRKAEESIKIAKSRARRPR